MTQSKKRKEVEEEAFKKDRAERLERTVKDEIKLTIQSSEERRHNN